MRQLLTAEAASAERRLQDKSAANRVLRISDGDDRHGNNNEHLEEDTRWDEYTSRPRSPCEISNDPDDNAVDRLATCNVTKYACEEEEDTSPPPSLELSFNYDIYAATAVSSLDAISYVEEAIFRETAEALGVDDCRMLFNQKWLRRRLQTLGYHSISSLEVDPEDVARDDACSSTFDTAGSEPVECVPVVGGFTVYGKGVNSLRRELLRFVEARMSQDAFVVDSLIYKVIFLEENRPQSLVPTSVPVPAPAVVPVPKPSPETPRNSDFGQLVNDDPSATTGVAEQSGATTGLIVVAAGLALVVLFAVLGIVRRRSRKKKNDRAVEVIEEPDYIFDVTDNSPPKGLAEKDSLALAPQRDILQELEPAVHILPRKRNIELEEDTLSLGKARLDEVESNASRSVQDDQESADEGSQSDAESQSDVERQTGADSFMIGGSLSLIDEKEEQAEKEEQPEEDHNLDFGEGASMASYDTRSSARRILQMT